MDEKKFIQNLYEEKTKNDGNSRSLASLLNVLTKTVFEDSNRFIFELLQNADDSPKEIGVANVEVNLKLLDKDLIFSHTGRHFSKEDVEGICNVGSGDSGKARDIDKTGYKGIGFKSIFRTCNRVYILSNKFSFKFDRNHFVWKNSQEYPWQMTPIWVEKSEIADDVLKKINSTDVNTLISIDDKNKIKNEIKEVFSDSRIMLFLRHVKSVTFLDHDTEIFKIERKKIGNNLMEIYENGRLQSTWIYKEFVVPVVNELREKLKLFDSSECPEKLKGATSTKITFAASIENENIKELSDASLYCYLPTKAKYGFPFLVNGDFLTNAERTQILENEWNAFLFNEIATCKVKWLAELAKQNKFKYQFTCLIKDKFREVGSSIIKKSFNVGLDKAIIEIPFILSFNSKESLMRVGECILDYTGFCDMFGSEMVTSYYGNNYKVADYKIQNLNKIALLGAKKFDIEDLCAIFLTDLFIKKCEAIEFNISIIKFLYSKEWTQQLKLAAFLIDDNYQLNTPEKVYFPLIQGDREITSIIDLKCINSNLYEYIKENEGVWKWLVTLGVKESSEIEIIRKSIVEMIKSERINSSNALQIGNFVFRVFQKGKLNDNDYIGLSWLKLLTNKENLEIPSKCYLPDYYDPELKIENVFPEGSYVSKKYVQKDSEIQQWKKMLIKLGVKEKISIKIEPTINREDLTKKYEKAKLYLNYIDNSNCYPYMASRYMYQHRLINVLFVDYLEYLHIYGFSKSFWRIILENNWNTIYSECKKSMYNTNVSESYVESFFVYYIKNNLSIPANNGKCYKSIDLYSASLKRAIGTYYPIVDGEIKFIGEQEEFLGIKSTIIIEDCLALLKNLENSKIDNNTIKQIEAIYKQIIKNKSDDRSIKTSSFEHIKLLGTDGTFQSVSSLYCFGIEELLPPSDSSYFIRLSDAIRGEDMETLCSAFNIPVVKYSNLKFSTKGIEKEEELFNEIKIKAKYLATIAATISGEEPKDILLRLLKKIAYSNFYKVQSLSMVYVGRQGEEIYKQHIESCFEADSNSVYYVGTWQSPLTLYSLSNSLCSFLELKDREREIALILQLSDDEIKDWFNSKEYKTIEMNNDELVDGFSNEMINPKNIEIENIELSGNNYGDETLEKNIGIDENATNKIPKSFMLCVDENCKYEIEKEPKYLTKETKVLISTIIKMEYEKHYNYLIENGKLDIFLNTDEGSVSSSKIIYEITNINEKRIENVVWDDYKKILLVTNNTGKDEIAEVLAKGLTIPETSDYLRLADSIELFLGSKECTQRINKRGTWIIPEEVKKWMNQKKEPFNKETLSESQPYTVLTAEVNDYKAVDRGHNDLFKGIMEPYDYNDEYLKEDGVIDETNEVDSAHDEKIDTKNVTFHYSENRGISNNINTNLIQNKKKYRLISYVSNSDGNDELDIKQRLERREHNLKIEDKARKVICNFEVKAQRIPMEMPKLQEGYDIISRNKVTGEILRYIHVKGLIGEWSNYDVAMLTSAQMKIAKEKEDFYWIYVIEFVDDEENMRIYRINNPFEKITKYAFDHGWRDASEQDRPTDKFLLGAKIEHNKYGLGVIRKVIEIGKLKLLIVDFNGEEKKVPLNLTQMKIVGGN
ncbi:MAG: hypothetical protein ACI8WT_001381 [Clostridium sp.]